METESNLIQQIAVGIAMIVTAATALSAVTPTHLKWGKRWLNVSLSVLNILAGNFLLNRNEDHKG